MKENRETFLQRIPGLSSEDQFLLEFAYDIAKEGHGYINQVRDSGERYFEHVRHVTLILIDDFGIRDISVLIPSLFHDLPEDVYIWKVPGRITQVFGEIIGTRSHTLAKPDKSKFSSKEDHLRFYFEQLKKVGWETCLIKIADRIHNLSSMSSGSWDSKRQEKYLIETKTYFKELVDVVSAYDEHLGNLASTKLQEAIDEISLSKRKVDAIE